MTHPIDEAVKAGFLAHTVARLRTSAEASSKASQYLADLKSERNRAAGDEGASYRGAEIHETIEWFAADLITAQAAQIEALEDALRNIEISCSLSDTKPLNGFDKGARAARSFVMDIIRKHRARSTLKDKQK